MNAAAVRAYDFRRSGFVDPALARQVRVWLTKAATVFQRRWEELSPGPLKARPAAPYGLSFANLVEALPRLATGCRMLAGAERVPCLVTVSQPGIQILVGQILCDNPTVFPEPRELTGIELDLCQLVFDGLRAALSEGWPQKEPLPVELVAVEPAPQRLRTCAPEEDMLVLPLAVDSSAGEVRLEMALPRNGLRKLLTPLLGPDTHGAAKGRNPLEPVLDIPVDVSVRLGTANVGMSDLARLQVGDVLVLGSLIHQPVEVEIDGDLVFLGWPGRVGPQQALKISERF